VLIAVLFLFTPVRAALLRLDEVDRSQDWEVYDAGLDTLNSIETGGRVVGLGETTLLRYFRDVLGLRPDPVLIPPPTAEERRQIERASLRRVGVHRDLPGPRCVTA
jgi:hypothetical protein